MEKPGKFCILSIDGGGLKGLIAIKILEIIEEICAGKITSLFNLIAGTSTGGLIASALTVPGTGNAALHDLVDVEAMYLEAIESLLQNKNGSTAKLSDLIRRSVNNSLIADTIVPIFVPSYDLYQKKIVVFKSRSALLNENKNVRLYDVCRATSAVPNIFPAYPVKYNGRQLNCEDAGWHIKNPALAALAEFWKHRSFYSRAGITESEVSLISVSTGNFYSNIGREWSTDVNNIMGSQKIAADYIREQQLEIDLLKINFLRVDLALGQTAYSFKTLMEIGNKIETLSADQVFRQEIKRLLMAG